MTEPKTTTVTGYSQQLRSGASIFAGILPEELGAGYALTFTNKEGERTNLFLSWEAFDALVLLHEWLTKPEMNTYSLCVNYDGKDVNVDKSEWTQINPPPAPPAATPDTSNGNAP